MPNDRNEPAAEPTGDEKGPPADLRKASDDLKAKIAEAKRRNDMPLDSALGNPKLGEDRRRRPPRRSRRRGGRVAGPWHFRWKLRAAGDPATRVSACCRYANLRDVPGRLGDDDLRRDVELDGVRGDRRNRTRRWGSHPALAE
jgi:hypothetical protein